MADCSQTEVFFAEWERMHKHYENEQCTRCPVRALANAIGEKDCIKAVFNMPKELVIGAVQRWSDAHPLPKPKTYADVFFEKFLKLKKTSITYGSGSQKYPIYCRDVLFGIEEHKCTGDRDECGNCWNEPYPEQEATT